MEKFPQQLRSVFHPGASGPHEMSPEASRVEMKPLRKPEVQAGGASDKEVLEMLDSKAFDTVIPKKGLDGLWTINTCLPHSEKDWVTVYFAVLRCYVVRVVPELERAGGNSKVTMLTLADPGKFVNSAWVLVQKALNKMHADDVTKLCQGHVFVAGVSEDPPWISDGTLIPGGAKASEDESHTQAVVAAGMAAGRSERVLPETVASSSQCGLEIAVPPPCVAPERLALAVSNGGKQVWGHQHPRLQLFLQELEVAYEKAAEQRLMDKNNKSITVMKLQANDVVNVLKRDADVLRSMCWWKTLSLVAQALSLEPAQSSPQEPLALAQLRALDEGLQIYDRFNEWLKRHNVILDPKFDAHVGTQIAELLSVFFELVKDANFSHVSHYVAVLLLNKLLQVRRMEVHIDVPVVDAKGFLSQLEVVCLDLGRWGTHSLVKVSIFKQIEESQDMCFLDDRLSDPSFRCKVAAMLVNIGVACECNFGTLQMAKEKAPAQKAWARCILKSLSRSIEPPAHRVATALDQKPDVIKELLCDSDDLRTVVKLASSLLSSAYAISHGSRLGCHLSSPELWKKAIDLQDRDPAHFWQERWKVLLEMKEVVEEDLCKEIAEKCVLVFPKNYYTWRSGWVTANTSDFESLLDWLLQVHRDLDGQIHNLGDALSLGRAQKALAKASQKIWEECLNDGWCRARLTPIDAARSAEALKSHDHITPRYLHDWCSNSVREDADNGVREDADNGLELLQQLQQLLKLVKPEQLRSASASVDAARLLVQIIEKWKLTKAAGLICETPWLWTTGSRDFASVNRSLVERLRRSLGDEDSGTLEIEHCDKNLSPEANRFMETISADIFGTLDQEHAAEINPLTVKGAVTLHLERCQVHSESGEVVMALCRAAIQWLSMITKGSGASRLDPSSLSTCEFFVKSLQQQKDCFQQLTKQCNAVTQQIIRVYTSVEERNITGKKLKEMCSGNDQKSAAVRFLVLGLKLKERQQKAPTQSNDHKARVEELLIRLQSALEAMEVWHACLQSLSLWAASLSSNAVSELVDVEATEVKELLQFLASTTTKDFGLHLWQLLLLKTVVKHQGQSTWLFWWLVQDAQPSDQCSLGKTLVKFLEEVFFCNMHADADAKVVCDSMLNALRDGGGKTFCAHTEKQAIQQIAESAQNASDLCAKLGQPCEHDLLSACESAQRWWHNVIEEVELQRLCEQLEEIRSVFLDLGLRGAAGGLEQLQSQAQLRDGSMNPGILRDSVQGLDYELHMPVLRELSQRGLGDDTSPVVALIRTDGMRELLQVFREQELDWYDAFEELFEQVSPWLCCPDSSLQDLCGKLPSRRSCRLVLDALTKVRAVVDQITETVRTLSLGSDVVEQLNSFIAHLKRLKDEGTLVFLREEASGLMTLQLCLGKSDIRDWTFLQEIERRAALFMPSVEREAALFRRQDSLDTLAEVNQAEHVRFFVEVHRQSLGMLELLRGLDQDGEPNLASVEKLSLSLSELWGEVHSAHSPGTSKEYQNNSCMRAQKWFFDLGSMWREQRASCMRDCPRLSFLLPSMMLQLIHGDRLVADEAKQQQQARHLLWWCFPDVTYENWCSQPLDREESLIADLRDVQQASRVATDLMQQPPELNELNPWSRGVLACLQHCVEGHCTNLGRPREVESSRPCKKVGYKLGYGVDGQQNSATCITWILTRGLGQDMDSPLDWPHFAQVLWCSPRTTWEGHLRPLLDAPFGDCPLFLLDVDLLPEAALSQLAERERKHGKGVLPRKVTIVYVFSEKASETDVMQLMQDEPLKPLDTEDDMIESLQSGIAQDSLSKLDIVEAVEIYHGRCGSGKSCTAARRWEESQHAGPRGHLVVDAGFQVEQLIHCLDQLHDEAVQCDLWHLCVHLKVEQDSPAALVSNALFGLVFQGVLSCDAGSGSIWAKPHPRMRLTFQIEFAEPVPEAPPVRLPFCEFLGVNVDMNPFDLQTVAALQAGTLQLQAGDRGEFVQYMRVALTAAEQGCLQDNQGVFKGVRPGMMPSVHAVQDNQIPALVVRLCTRFSIAVMGGDPTEEEGEELNAHDFRRVAQFCRLLGLRFELLTKLERDQKTDMHWRLLVVVKECLIAVMGWSQWDPANPKGARFGCPHLEVDARYGLFRQRMVLSFRSVLEADFDNGVQRRSMEEYMVLNMDEGDEFLKQILSKCAQAGLAPTVDRSDTGGDEEALGSAEAIFKDCAQRKTSLRQKLGVALELDDTAECLHAVRQQKFVLTPDTVAKAWLISMRMQLGYNMILQGHTGVGKTEIMELLQHLFALPRQSMVHPTRSRRLDQLKCAFRAAGVDWTSTTTNTADAALAAWCEREGLSSAHALTENPRLSEEAGDSHISMLSSLCGKVRCLLIALPCPPGFSKSLPLPVDEPNGLTLMRHLLELCHAYIDAEPCGTYIYELIHPGVTSERLDQIIADAIEAARFWHRRAEGRVFKLHGAQTRSFVGVDEAEMIRDFSESTASSLDNAVEWCARAVDNGDADAFTLQLSSGTYLAQGDGRKLISANQARHTGHFKVRQGRLCDVQGRPVRAQWSSSIAPQEIKVEEVFAWSGKPWSMHSKGSFQPVTLFLDELNTARHLQPVLNSAYADRKFHGVPLPPNLYLFGAINPLKRDASIFTVHDLPHAMKSLLIEFGQLDHQTERKFMFSMLAPTDASEIEENRAAADWRQLSVQGKALSLQALCPDLRLRLGQCVLRSHELIKSYIERDRGHLDAPERMTECHTVTIRDFLRCCKIFLWLLKEAIGGLACLLQATEESTEEWSAVFAVIFTYSFRLPTFRQRLRFIEELERFFTSLKAPDSTTWAQHVQKKFEELARWVSEQAREELRALDHQSHDATSRANDTILYGVFDQNVLACVLGQDADIPLMIVAPPGHSKTYSVTLANQVLQTSPPGRKTDFFKTKPQLVRVFNYQGSSLSTAHQLMQVHDDAKRRSREVQNLEARSFRRIVAWLIDEAGLINGVAMKCLHRYLEESDPHSTLLANQQLDAAKSNRVLLLRQFQITPEDLRSLIRGALLGSRCSTTGHMSLVQNEVVQGLKNFWTEEDRRAMGVEGEVLLRGIQEEPVWKAAFHLRDLLWKLRQLKHNDFMRHVIQQEWEKASNLLTMACIRNFGGLDEVGMQRILDWEFRCMKEALLTAFPNAKDNLNALFKPNFCPAALAMQEERSSQDCRAIWILDALRESLLDHASPEDDLNHTWYRYIMVIDRTGSYATHSLLREAFPDLFNHMASNQEDVGVSLDGEDNDLAALRLSRLSLSDFPEEVGAGDECLAQARAKADVDMVLQVCQRMAFPGLCICSNFSRITTSFFHVWNRHFKRGIQKQEGCYPTYMAQVSVGASSDQKMVHPKFKFVLEIPESIDQTEMALRNRTEKFELDVYQVLMWRLKHACGIGSGRMHWELARCIKVAVDAAEQWAASMGGGLMFCGFVAKNTTPSIMLQLLARMSRQATSRGRWNAQSLGRAICAEQDLPNSGGDTLVSALSTMDDEACLLTMLKFYLAQVCFPFMAAGDRMSEGRDEMLGRLYFHHQEHISWTAFLRLRIQNVKAAMQSSSNSYYQQKLVVFTEPCAILADPDGLKKMLLSIDPDSRVGILDLAGIKGRQACAESLWCAFHGTGRSSIHGEENIYGCREASSKNNDCLHILVVLVSTKARHFKSSQLAYVRAEIDRHMDYGSNVLVLCFVAPSKTLLRKSAVSSLWLDGWDFHTLDLHASETVSTPSEVVRSGFVRQAVSKDELKDVEYPKLRFDHWVESELDLLAQRPPDKSLFSATRQFVIGKKDAGFEVGETLRTSALQVSRQERRSLMQKLLHWNHDAVLVIIFEHMNHLIRSGGARRLLLELCKQSAKLEEASLAGSLWLALENWAQSMVRFYLKSFLSSLPLELLSIEGDNDMKRLVQKTIAWIRPPSSHYVHGNGELTYRCCTIPMFPQLDTYVSKLVQGPSLATDPSPAVLASGIALQHQWQCAHEALSGQAWSQPGLKPLLEEMGSDRLFRSFCRDSIMALVQSVPSQHQSWSEHAVSFTSELLSRTACQATRNVLEMRPLFVHWFLKHFARALLHVLSLAELLPSSILESSTVQVINAQLPVALFGSLLAAIGEMGVEAWSDKIQAAVGGMASVLHELFKAVAHTAFSTADAEMEKARDDLGRAYLDASLLACSWDHLGTSHLEASLGTIVKLRHNFKDNGTVLDPQYTKAGLLGILRCSDPPATVEIKSRVAVHMLDACSQILAQAPTGHGKGSTRSRELQEKLLQLAEQALSLVEEGMLTGAGLRVFFSSKSVLESQVQHLDEFWTVVNKKADKLGLSDSCFDLRARKLDEQALASWREHWTAADELACLRVSTLLKYTYKGEPFQNAKKLALKCHEKKPKVGEGAWKVFEYGAHRAAAIEAMVQAVRKAVLEDHVQDFLDAIQEDQDGLQRMQELMEGAETQVQFMTALGQELRSKLCQENGLLEKLCLRDWADDSCRNVNEMPWFCSRTRSAERDLCEQLLKLAPRLDGSVEQRQSDPVRQQAADGLKAYIRGKSQAHARFVVGTVAAHIVRQGRDPVHLQQWLQTPEIRRLLHPDDTNIRCQSRSEILQHLSSSTLTRLEHLKRLQDLWMVRDGAEEGRMYSFAYVLCFLAAVAPNSSFMHFRLFPSDLRESMARGLAGVGSHTFRDSNSLKDCGYRTWESRDATMFPIKPQEFSGSAGGRAWGCYLTWASLGAACLLDHPGTRQVLVPYLQGAIGDYGHLPEQERQIQHILDRMDCFWRVLVAENEGDGLGAATLIGQSLWEYVDLCEAQRADHRPYLIHEVHHSTLSDYETFLFRNVYTVGRRQALQQEQTLLAAGKDQLQLLASWQDELAARRSCNPTAVTLRDLLAAPQSDEESQTLAAVLHSLIEGVDVARLSALRLLPVLARLSRWLRSIVSAYVEVEVIDRLGAERNLTLAEVKRIISERLPNDQARQSVELKLEQLRTTWNDFAQTCTISEACEAPVLPQMPDDLQFPLAFLLVSKATRNRQDADNYLAQMLSTLSRVNNDIAQRLSTTRLGSSRNVGRSIIDCPMLPSVSPNLLAKTLAELDLARFAPLYTSRRGDDCAEEGLKWTLDVAAFAVLLLDAGVCNCAQLPLSAEIHKWLLLEPSTEDQLPCWTTSFADTEATRLPEMPSRPKTAMLSPELRKLQDRCNVLQQTIESHLDENPCLGEVLGDFKSDRGRVDKVLGKDGQGFLSRMEVCADTIEKLSRQLDQALDSTINSVDWSRTAAAEVQGLRLQEHSPVKLPYNLGLLLLTEIPALLEGLTCLSLQKPTSSFPKALCAKLRLDVKARVQEHVESAANCCKQEERRAAADSLAAWHDGLLEDHLEQLQENAQERFGHRQCQSQGASSSSALPSPDVESWLKMPENEHAKAIVEALLKAADENQLQNCHAVDIMELLTHEIASLMTPRWTAAELEEVGLEGLDLLDDIDFDI